MKLMYRRNYCEFSIRLVFRTLSDCYRWGNHGCKNAGQMGILRNAFDPDGTFVAKHFHEIGVDMNEESDTRQYCVTVKIYTQAADKYSAIDNVIEDLEYLIESDSAIAGFIHPTAFDVKEDDERKN